MVRRVLPGCNVGSRSLVERLRDTILCDAASTSGYEFGYRFLVDALIVFGMSCYRVAL